MSTPLIRPSSASNPGNPVDSPHHANKFENKGEFRTYLYILKKTVALDLLNIQKKLSFFSRPKIRAHIQQEIARTNKDLHQACLHLSHIKWTVQGNKKLEASIASMEAKKELEDKLLGMDEHLEKFRKDFKCNNERLLCGGLYYMMGLNINDLMDYLGNAGYIILNREIEDIEKLKKNCFRNDKNRNTTDQKIIFNQTVRNIFVERLPESFQHDYKEIWNRFLDSSSDRPLTYEGAKSATAELIRKQMVDLGEPLIRS